MFNRPGHPPTFPGDVAQARLLDFIEETQRVLSCLLCTLDPNAWCQILPAIDLGIPHDAMRLAGGFPTGIAVEWNCKVPIVPVDCTVNICTSSVFELVGEFEPETAEQELNRVLGELSASSYELNFHRGNHFISYTRDCSSGKSYLVVHSSSAEFKHRYNGLYPVEGNWYFDQIKVFRSGNRFLRYIEGSCAQCFTDLASSIPSFNESRHRFVADLLSRKFGGVYQAFHSHHYLMPTPQSVLIGSVIAKPGDIVPIFSRPGQPLYLFQAQPGGQNHVTFNGENGLIVPHGWGKGCSSPTLQLSVDPVNMTMELNGRRYDLHHESSLRDHPDLSIRQYETNENSEDYYFRRLAPFVAGNVVTVLIQIVSFSKAGVKRWDNR